jgi:hypothetical protein
VQVRRSGDSAEDTFSATEVGDGTLAAWVTAGGGTEDGFVKTWYDQSGNGNDASQATAASQPQIVASGAVIQTNSNPAIKFDADYLTHPLPTNAGYSVSHGLFALTNVNTSNAYSLTFSAGNNADASNGICMLTNATGTAGQNWGTYAGTSRTANTSLADGQQRLLVMLRGSSGDGAFYLDGASDGTYVSTSGATQRAVGHPNTKDNIQEVIFYASDQSSNRTGIESNIASHYGITLS